jgi:hypothetical protein
MEILDFELRGLDLPCKPLRVRFHGLPTSSSQRGIATHHRRRVNHRNGCKQPVSVEITGPGIITVFDPRANPLSYQLRRNDTE